MFERFTRSARAAVTEAQAVAVSSGASGIDSRHLTIALLRMDPEVRSAIGRIGMDPDRLVEAVSEEPAEGLDAEALALVGIDLEDVRAHTDAIFGEGALDRAGRSRARPPTIPFGKDAKKALELALREAVRSGGRQIDGGHLLLGILRGECLGRSALIAAGVDVGRLRGAIKDRESAS